MFVGYRHYEKAGIKPLFPFGHGLSYTTFDWGAPTVDRPSFDGDGLVTVRVKVTNSGARPGSEVVQLYVVPPASQIERPAKELRAFAKLHLAPGETADATMTLSARAFSYFDTERNAFVAERGRYQLIVATSSTAPRGSIDIDLTREIVEAVQAPLQPLRPANRQKKTRTWLDHVRAGKSATLRSQRPRGVLSESELGFRRLDVDVMPSSPAVRQRQSPARP